MKVIKTILLLSCLLPSWSSWADESGEIQVIVNSQIDLSELNRKQIMGLFLGRARSFPNGEIAKPFDNEMGSKIRSSFFENLTGKSISDIDAYWARLRYSGRSAPPKVLKSLEQILAEVSQNKNAIAYIAGQNETELAEKGITVVHTLMVADN